MAPLTILTPGQWQLHSAPHELDQKLHAMTALHRVHADFGLLHKPPFACAMRLCEQHDSRLAPSLAFCELELAATCDRLRARDLALRPPPPHPQRTEDMLSPREHAKWHGNALRAKRAAITWVARPLPMKAEGAEKAAAEATTAEATTVRSIFDFLESSTPARSKSGAQNVVTEVQ